MIKTTSVFVILGLVCPDPKIENRTSTWTKDDQKMLEQAKTRCGQIYSDSPCVKMFRKNEEQGYSVICKEKSSAE